MSAKANELAKRVRGFTNDVYSFVEKISKDDWKKKCSEDWSVGVTARHIGAGHFDTVDLTGMIVNEKKLPEITEEQIVEMANQHAREHADCTKDEVLDILKTKGGEMADFVAGLSDEELERSAYFSVMNTDLTARQWVEAVILQSANEHFDSIKKAVKS